MEDVFTLNDFNRHLDEVKAKLTDYEPELIEDVVKFHLSQMALEVQKIRPWKRRVYIYSWGFIEIFPWIFNTFSPYFDSSVKKKYLNKFRKEVEQFNLNNDE